MKLDLWMQKQGDEGQATEMKALERMPAKAKEEQVSEKPKPQRKAGAKNGQGNKEKAAQ